MHPMCTCQTDSKQKGANGCGLLQMPCRSELMNVISIYIITKEIACCARVFVACEQPHLSSRFLLRTVSGCTQAEFSGTRVGTVNTKTFFAMVVKYFIFARVRVYVGSCFRVIISPLLAVSFLFPRLGLVTRSRRRCLCHSLKALAPLSLRKIEVCVQSFLFISFLILLKKGC